MTARSLQPRRFALLRAVVLVAAVAFGVIELAQRFLLPRLADGRATGAASTAAPRVRAAPAGFGDVFVPALPEGATVEVDGRAADTVHQGGAHCERTPDPRAGDTLHCRFPSGEIHTLKVHVPGREDDAWTIAVPDPGGRTTLLH